MHRPQAQVTRATDLAIIAYMQCAERFREVVRGAVADQSLSRIAVRAGLPRNAIRNVLMGHEPLLSRAAEVAAALNLEFYIGPSRDESMPAAPTSSEPPPWAADLRDDLLKQVSERLATSEHLSVVGKAAADEQLEDESATVDPAVALDQPAYRPVAVGEMDAAAGGGAWDPDERVTKWVYFRREWLDRHAIQPNLCRVIGVRGESMETTLPDGCSILVDRNRRRRREGRIYVVRSFEGVVVKRARQDERGNWLLVSDNPQWEAKPWEADDVTIGEVRWMARTLG